jgi:ABC-type transporter MlaC component
MGIWLVEVYQDQFAEAIESSGIDGLIRSLEAKG